jgi:hypothetical protein
MISDKIITDKQIPDTMYKLLDAYFSYVKSKDIKAWVEWNHMMYSGYSDSDGVFPGE